ncbi:hypothetical protein BC332_07488 [Capsicum chinense]|nr:hypothetical protein BC332_07488 [Capsicum chinense]
MYENKDKMDEVWIKYCGMPACFGWKEFAIVTGLKCYPPSQVIPILTQKKHPAHPKKAKASRVIMMTWCPLLVQASKTKILIETLKGKGLSKKHKQSLCLAWAFEAIPYLRQQVNYQEGVSCPRILRWLSAKTHKNAKFLDLFNPPKDAGGLVVFYGAVGGGSGAAVGANHAPLIVFKANYYEYDHTGYTNFASPSKCFACKCQDCRTKHDVVINAINVLTAFVKELTSKRGLIPSKRILFLSAPLEIRAKRRRRVISKALLEQKEQKPYASDNEDPRRAKPNSIAPDEEQLKLGGCDYFDWYEERHPSQANRVIWGLLNKVKASEEKQNRARRYYIVAVIATGLKLGGYDYFDWYEERHPSQANRVIWGLLNKVKASEEKQNRARRYYIIAVIATGLVLLDTCILKSNC